MDTWIPGSIVVKIHIYVKLVILFILLVCQPDSFLADDISFTKDQFHCSHKPPSKKENVYILISNKNYLFFNSLGKSYLSFNREEDFLEINQSETRIAYGSHVC
jgi:hypothetical protein